MGPRHCDQSLLASHRSLLSLDRRSGFCLHSQWALHQSGSYHGINVAIPSAGWLPRTYAIGVHGGVLLMTMTVGHVWPRSVLLIVTEATNRL
jgi:hypothetical protein